VTESVTERATARCVIPADASEDQPATPGTELTGGRCRVREIYVPGGTFTMGRGYCPSAGVH